MVDVIKVGEVTHTIFDVNDILQIVMKECGSDTYAWLQNYLDEKQCEIQFNENQIEKLTQHYELYMDDLINNMAELKSAVDVLDMNLSKLP